MSREELLIELSNHKALGWRASVEAEVEDGLIELIKWDVTRPMRDIKTFEAKISKLKVKINSLK